MSQKQQEMNGEISPCSTTVRFETKLGNAEVSWDGDVVTRFNWRSARANSRQPTDGLPFSLELTLQQRNLIQDIVDYAAGERIDFSEVLVDFSDGTLFQQRVWQACQKIPYGEVITYGELAKRAGRPGAARAVGMAMSRNRIPIIVPCHRVIAAGNKIGGFTSPQGIRRKKNLLDLEMDGDCRLGMPLAPNSQKR